jgi:hypothetical protein
MKILDRELGAKLRAIVSIGTAATTALTLLASQIDALPEGADTASVALLIVSALITFVGRFTQIGDKTHGA